jgi:hypothetical protein
MSGVTLARGRLTAGQDGEKEPFTVEAMSGTAIRTTER